MKIISVVGARPQFIKVALLSRRLRESHDEAILHTGQHYDVALSQAFFDELEVPEPKWNLGIGSATHARQTGDMMIAVEQVLLSERPDLVIVVGDTNSTLAGALVAAKLGISIAHVEAGMRNWDRQKPEEINRVITDHLSDLLFAPTRTALANLRREGLDDNAFLVGDVSYDVLQRYRDRIKFPPSSLAEMDLEAGQYFLLTVHKQKNTDSADRLLAIIGAARKLEQPVIFPAHPRTKKRLQELGQLSALTGSNVRVIDPLRYLEFLGLLQNASKVITDSGGVQKDAYALETPCVTLRETEWVETVELGWNKVVETDEGEIVHAAHEIRPRGRREDFLGDGTAHGQIARILDSLALPSRF